MKTHIYHFSDIKALLPNGKLKHGGDEWIQLTDAGKQYAEIKTNLPA
jgi:hypothetical protein